MSEILTFQPGISLAQGKYLLRSAVQPGRWSVTIQAIRASDLAAVVIKTPLDLQAQSRFQSAWMRRSFQALGDLNHPSRARILDWFEQDGRPFLVLQKVKGLSLEQQLQQGPLSEAVALQLIRQVAAGLAGIHCQGLLHRDIQPKNIILRQGVGIPTLVDWGLQPAQSPGDRLTPFSAPEQLQGGDIFKQRLDIYSLAATFYAAATGKAPLHPAQRHHQVPNPGPASLAGLIPPRQLQPGLSPATEQAILQGMALDPQHRPATLENWLHLFPLSHSPVAATQGRGNAQSYAATGDHHNPGQMWATQPPPSNVSVHRVSVNQSSASNPPGFSPAQQGNIPQDVLPHIKAGATPSRPTPSRPITAQPSLPQRPGSPYLAGTNYTLGSSPQKTTPSQPSEQQRSPRSRTGTVAPSYASKGSDFSQRKSPYQATYATKTMANATQRAHPASAFAPFNPCKRLISISLFMASIGLAGGLFLRVLNPASVSGFSGLGRAQNFPEANWPGETQLEDMPGDLPQPELSGDRRDSTEDLPEVILDQATEDRILVIPSEQVNEPARSPRNPTADDYEKALGEQSSPPGYERENDAYSEPYGGNTPSFPEEGYSDIAPDDYGDNDYQDDAWSEEAPSNWPGEPGITADDFPEPDFPPANPAPNPQSAIPLPTGAPSLHEDV